MGISQFYVTLEKLYKIVCFVARLLKLNSSGKKAARRQLELGSLLRMSQDNEDELLELCSGKFTAGLLYPKSCHMMATL